MQEAGWSERPSVCSEYGMIMKKKRILKSLSFAVLFLLPGSPFSLPLCGEKPPLPSDNLSCLSQVFRPGPILQDRNEDGVVDHVQACIVLPEKACREEIAAASAVAARLGFETSALTLPLVKRDFELENLSSLPHPVVIGNTNRLVEENPWISEQLSLKGCGIIALVPPPYGGSPWVAVLGEEGHLIREAALSFASRSPYLWDVLGRETGATYDTLKKDLAFLLAEEGAHPSLCSITSIAFRPRGDPDPEREEVELKERELQAFAYRGGEIEILTVAVEIGEEEIGLAGRALHRLREDHQRGKRTDVLNYPGVARIKVTLKAPALSLEFSIPRIGLPQRLLNREIHPEFLEPRKKPSRHALSLSQLYSCKGLLEDQRKNGIPDALRGRIFFESPGEGMSIPDLAARLALESAGISIPLLHLNGKLEDLEFEPAPILVGFESEPVRYLQKLGKIKSPMPAAGEGFIAVVEKAFNETDALLIGGGDEEGTSAALSHAARRVPFLWNTGSGETTLADIEEEVKDFFRLRATAGQAAEAFVRAQESLRKLSLQDPSSVEGELLLREGVPGLERLFLDRIGESCRCEERSFQVASYRDASVVFEESFSVPWEVEEFQKIFREKVLPSVRPGAPVTIDGLVSEPPEMRREMEEEIRRELLQRGASEYSTQVRVLSAYKQGFSWLTERIAPELKGKRAGRIEISFKPDFPSLEERRRFHPDPMRWLQELYPVDEVLANELNLSPDAVQFTMKEDLAEIYTVLVQDDGGRTLLEDSFSPKWIHRHFLEKYRGWFQVKATTGWLRAQVGEEIVVDQRVVTDPERVWDWYQEKILPRVHEHIMKKTGSDPTREKQPFFRRLAIEVWMSEPDYRLGIDEEQISSLESMHEDLYFNTFEYMNGLILGKKPGKEPPKAERAMQSQGMGSPGSILPIIHPSRLGPGEAKVTFTVNRGDGPHLLFRWKRRGDEKEREDRISLKGIEPSPPRALFETVRVGKEGVQELGILVELEKEEDAAKAADLVAGLRNLHERGLFTDFLSRPSLNSLSLMIRSKTTEAIHKLPFAGRSPKEKGKSSHPAEEVLVKLDHIIGPEECEEIIEKLSRFPEIHAFRAGESYEGRPISVMEITLPVSEGLRSRAKTILYKPALLCTARQHANEVSSTGYLLKMAELLATDPAYRKYLQRINFVFHPMENPDGASIAMDLQKLTPHHALHAGRYSALGTEIGYEINNPDTLVTEALVRNRLYQNWLPDIALNLHGYPSHEWVHPFAGYAPYLFRSYWIPRGWFTYLQFVRDSGHPMHGTAGEILMKYIEKEVSSDPEVRESNRRLYARYQKWACSWNPHISFLERTGEANIYHKRRGPTETEKFRPRREITFAEAVPEVMDETAQGEWLGFVSSQGLSFLEAFMKFLEEASFTVERLEEEKGGRVHITLHRPRPVQPNPKAR